MKNVTVEMSLSRRRLIQQSAAIGIVMTGAGGLLSACTDIGDTPNTPESEFPQSTATPTVDAEKTATPDSIPPVMSPTATATPVSQPSPSPSPSPLPSATPSPPASDLTSTPTLESAEPTKYLTIDVGHEIASLHPDDVSSTATWIAVANILDGLVEIDADFHVQPVLARSFETSADGRTYTFHLHDGVRFHDGQELTADDVAFSVERLRSPEAPPRARLQFERVERIDVVDRLTVSIVVGAVDSSFLARALTTFILPRTYHESVGKDGYAVNPVGTGPFRVDPERTDGALSLTAYDAYFRGPSTISGVTIQAISDEEQRWTRLMDGASDHAVGPFRPSPVDDTSARPRVSWRSGIGVALEHMPLNNDHPPFSEREVRRAMLLSIDRERLIDEFEHRRAVLAHSHLSPAVPAFADDDLTIYEFDPERARQLLDAAGWLVGADSVRVKSDMRLSFTCTVISGDQRRAAMAREIQTALADVGVEMSIEEAPVSTIVSQLTRPGVQMQASMFAWSYGGVAGDADAQQSLMSSGPYNYSHYRNDAVDALQRQAAETLDSAMRLSAYAEVQRIVADDVPFLFFWFPEWFQAWNFRVTGVTDFARNPDAVYRHLYRLQLMD